MVAKKDHRQNEGIRQGQNIHSQPRQEKKQDKKHVAKIQLKKVQRPAAAKNARSEKKVRQNAKAGPHKAKAVKRGNGKRLNSADPITGGLCQILAIIDSILRTNFVRYNIH